MPDYSKIAGPGLTFAGVDQGIDFTGRGQVFALARGVVTRLVSSGSGWPGEGALLVYQITAGPAKGKSVYIAEDFAARSGLKVGSRVEAGQALGMATGSGKAPGIETGWATSAGHPVATLGADKRAATQAGQDFLGFVTGSAGVPSADPGSATAPSGDATSTTTASQLVDDSLAAQGNTQGANVLQGNQAALPGTGLLDPVQRGQQETWQLLSQLPGASSDTMRFAQLAGLGDPNAGA